MPAFEYKALDATRENRNQGVLEADAPRAGKRQKLRKRLTPWKYEPSCGKKSGGGPSLNARGSLNAADLALVTRPDGDLDPVREIPFEQTPECDLNSPSNPRIRSMLIALRAKVMEGL